jgi:hypothetical protein
MTEPLDRIVVRSATRRTVLNERHKDHPNGEVQVGGLNPTLVARTPAVLQLIQDKALVPLYSAHARERAEEQLRVLTSMGQGAVPDPAVRDDFPELRELDSHEEEHARSLARDQNKAAEELKEAREEATSGPTRALSVTAPGDAPRPARVQPAPEEAAVEEDRAPARSAQPATGAKRTQ